MTRVTIRDVAQKAGVSITSVSFAYNNPGRLPEGTVQKILEIAEEIGYVPNPIARSMLTGRIGVIGILVPQPITEIIRNPFLEEFIEGVAEVCLREGYSILLVPPFEGSVKRAAAKTAVDGFITLGLELYKSTILILRQRRVPFVIVDTDPVEGISSVNITDKKGAYSIMKYVLSQGHRKIGILGIRSGKMGKFEEYTGTLRSRIDGYQQALREYRLSIGDPLVKYYECSSTMHGGEEGFNYLYSKDPSLTCIVSMSDVIAFGVIRAANQKGLEIPGDISVTGYDDVPYAEISCPALTTVSQPLKKKGKAAANLLIEHVCGKTEVTQKVFKSKLVIRNSVKDVN
ncbi:MAG: LacI family DNA-binding transcriptional regulator [Bacillota bacterium]|jgi:DNA-binding LacI/PurR family transcriptional regulator